MSDRRPVSPLFRWIRRKGIGFMVLLLALAGIAWLAARSGGLDGKRPGAGSRPRPAAALANLAAPVRVASAVTQDIDIFLKSLGTVTAYNTVTVRSRVSGELVAAPFQEGQRVKAGDLLAQIDPRAFQVALDQARGAQIQNLALLENARRDLQRYRTLFKQDSIARQQVETQAALVRQYEGASKSGQANVDNARLQLAYARITAPIDGRLGLRQVDRGNLVSSSDANGLVVITQTQPIAVVFTLPETQLPQVRAELATGKTLLVDVYDRADTRRIAAGTLETLDNQIDVTTGTLKFKARFDNQDDALFPNQFVNVRLRVLTRKGVTAIPTAAVQQGSAGAFVFRVRPDHTVQVQPVNLGAADNGMVAVNEGLRPGDRVVTEGTDRLRAGAKVEIVGGDERIPAANNKPLGATPAAR